MSTSRRESPGEGPTTTEGPEVMASVDGEGAEERLVIADVSRDGAWLAVSTEASPVLAEWR